MLNSTQRPTLRGTENERELTGYGRTGFNLFLTEFSLDLMYHTGFSMSDIKRHSKSSVLYCNEKLITTNNNNKQQNTEIRIRYSTKSCSNLPASVTSENNHYISYYFIKFK